MLAYVGQLFMLHSCDLVSFYVCLEAQNFCFLVLCGLQPNTSKSTKKDIKSSSQARTAAALASPSVGLPPHLQGRLASPSALKGVGIKSAGTVRGAKYNNTTPSTYFNNGSALFSVEASLKYLLLSAFSSGVILF
jgi:hypothetical protein